MKVGEAEVVEQVIHRVLCPVPQIALHPGSTNVLGDLSECWGWISYNYGLSVWLEIGLGRWTQALPPPLWYLGSRSAYFCSHKNESKVDTEQN